MRASRNTGPVRDSRDRKGVCGVFQGCHYESYRDNPQKLPNEVGVSVRARQGYIGSLLSAYKGVCFCSRPHSSDLSKLLVVYFLGTAPPSLTVG